MTENLKDMRILHISPHLGGGVGAVIRAWMEKIHPNERHIIVCLDKNMNREFRDWPAVQKCQVHIIDGAYFRQGYAGLMRRGISNADVVILHWWNHPLIYELMLNQQWPACRLIAWNHVSGLFPPYSLPESAYNFADIFVHTSHISKKITDKYDSSYTACETIWSTVDISRYGKLPRKDHHGCITGYTGTADKGKLHKDYIRMSANSSGCSFFVCSGDSQIHLQRTAALLDVEKKFSFLGRVPSLDDWLPVFDIFGYPLQPAHFGTCEQSLGEAMMSGCVPVVMNNPTEKYIVRDGVDGLVARSQEEYSAHLTRLAADSGLRKKLAGNARKRAAELYDLDETIGRWNCLVDRIMTQPKKMRCYGNNQPCSPAGLYAHSLGENGASLWRWLHAASGPERREAESMIRKLFSSNPMFSSASKASPAQYLQFFPDDTILSRWAYLANEG